MGAANKDNKEDRRAACTAGVKLTRVHKKETRGGGRSLPRRFKSETPRERGTKGNLGSGGGENERVSPRG